MLSRLDYGTDRDVRAELDDVLDVTAWQVPGTRTHTYVRAREDVPTGAPAWWHGDEEASQSFMREMGVN